jgi:hypothetical protein
MKAPVLVVADEAGERAIRAALEPELDVTVTDSVTRARALASTGAFVAAFATTAFATGLPEAVLVDPQSGDIAATARSAIQQAMARQFSAARSDEVGALAHEEYVELARYALMRRYLIALLARHNGSVTDAARGADLKRESLHRLMRRYHVDADHFRP